MNHIADYKHRKESIYPIIINGNSLVSSTYNNKFRYQFPVGAVNFRNSRVAVGNISMYYSWFNITANNNNNAFSFTWEDAVGTTTYNVSIDDGFYDIVDLNSYLQDFCVANGLYLVDSAGDYVYYLELVANSTYYAIQFNSYPIPTALPSGYTNPAGITFPAVATTPQLIVNSTDSFGDIIGFAAGTFPTVVQATNYSVLSTITPQVSVVQSLILACTLLNNSYSIPNTALYSFDPSNTSFGSLISVEPSEHTYVDIQDGTYPFFEIEFLDQSFNPIYINDTNLVVQLLIKNTDDDER